MTCRFDHADLRTHLKLFWGRSDVSRKIRPKPKKCMDFRAEMPGVQIECKSCHCDRVDLRTHVNAFSCQSDAHNKLGPKTLNVHRCPCWGSVFFFFGFLALKTPMHVTNGM
jgi:hypothetical protein